MADVNANIGVNIDTSAALAQLKSLQRQISQFNTSIARSSEQSALAQKSLNTNLINSINSIGAFSAELRTIKTTSEQFTASLESNKFSMREYFRYAGGATKTFGKLFRSEFDTISNVAEERVKRLQTQYIKLGRDSSGAMKAIAVIPKELNMADYNTQIQMAAQRQALFNQLMKQGSTNLINFGKNTQWAGRQLMVGFTIPLSILGNTASRVFMDMETQAIKFKKVYGDLFTPKEETQQALADVQALASMFTQYGVAASQTVGLAAEAAAAGFSGIDLQRQTTEATRLSVLGQIDSQKALETTISLQNAFAMSSDKLAESIDFLNAVENQTVVSLDDITTAIPKVGPIIQQLGGDVKDLAFFMAAMKEGGVNASEGANALKSGLAALINPTEKASAMLKGMGINIRGIIEANQGNLKNTVVEFAKSLDTLDPLTRARAIEQLFGKFQFARLSALFSNVTQSGNQASRVLDLASSSIEDLAALSEQELEISASSSMNKFKKAIEDLKLALVPVGQTFLDAITPIINFIGGILEKFNDLSAGTKRVITILTVGLGAVGPVLLMTFGLLANGVGNLIKLFLTLRNGYLRLTGQSQILGEQTQYLTTEQLEAEAVAHSLNQSHAKLTQTFTAETGQLNQLAAAYQRALGAMQRFSVSNPGSMLPPRRMAKGGVVIGPGTGTSDSIPAMLSNGETVVPAKQSKKYGGLINGIIADNIPGYQGGLRSAARAHLTAPFSSGSAQFQQGIELAGLQELATVYPQFIKVVSNLIAELPQSLNILLEKGTASINQFSTAWTAKTNKMLSSVKAGGENISDPAIVTALDSVEQEIHDRTIVLAQGTEGQKVSDDLLSQATREVIEKYKGMSSALGRVTKALDTASQQVGQVRVQPRSNVPGISNAEYLRRGIASGEFTQTGSNVFAGTTQIARESQSTKGKLRPASSFNPAGSYTRQPFRSEPKAVVDSLVMQTADAAQTQSPSRRTIPIGEDIARGLEVGMQNRQDDVARVASQLGETAVTESGLIVPRSAMSGSASLNSLSSRAQLPAEKIKQTQTYGKMQIFNDRISKMNNVIMGSTFALTSLAGAGSMAGGKIGEISSQIFKYSGLLFGLMSITQLLTQAKIAELAATRLSAARSAVKAASGGFGIAGRGLAARSGVLGIVGKLAVGMKALLGPVGLAVGVTSLLVYGFRKMQKAQEEARRKVLAFGNALTTSKKQAESTAEYFGVSLKKNPLEQDRSSQVDSGRYNTELRKQLDDFQASDTFKNDYKGTIADLKMLSDSEAKTALLVRIQNLMGQGYSEEQIRIIISSLQEAAGKTAIKLNFKDLKVDSVNKDVLAGLQPKIAELAKFSGGRGFDKTFVPMYDPETKTVVPKEVLTQTKEYSLALENVGISVKAVISNLALLQSQGKISTKDLQQSFNGLMYSIKTNTQDSGTQVLLLNKALEGMNDPLAKAAMLTDDLTKKTKLMNAAILGAVIPTAMLNAYLFDGGSGLYSQGILSTEIDKIIAKAGELNDKFKKAVEDQTKTGLGAGEKSWLQKLNDQTEATLTQTTAFYKMRDAGIEAGLAMELASNPDFAKGISEVAEKGGAAWNAAIKAIKSYKKAQDDLRMAEIAGMDQGDYELQRLNKAQAYIDLQTHFIEMQYSAQLDIIDKAQEENDLLLQRIAYQETLINNRYNPIIDQLQKIQDLNKSIADIEARRVDVVTALSSGDIAGGVRALTDLRSARGAQTGQSQIDSLNAARERELALVKQNNLTKEQLDLQNQKLALDKKEIQSTIAKQTANLTYFNMTRSQIDNAAKALDLSKSAGIDINNESFLNKVLDAAIGKTGALEAAMKSAAGAMSALFALQESARTQNIPSAAPTVTAMPQLFTTTSASGTKITTPWDTGAGKVIKRSMGGMVPKYFANGGFSRGTDTIPAMLTAGEYVIRKSAVDSLGVGAMNSINNGNMPSTPVYNYSLSVNVGGSNSSADDIARAVMSEIKRVDSQRVRGVK